MSIRIIIETLSDTCFGSGQGVPGDVDTEIVYDPDTGLPFVEARTIKGLLLEECSSVLFSLKESESGAFEPTARAAAALFGSPGTLAGDAGRLRVGTASLDPDFRDAIAEAVRGGALSVEDVHDSMTHVRTRTAEDPATGAPERGSLRSERVVPAGIRFTADLGGVDGESGEAERGLLAACTLAVRRAGLGRNRGRGHVACHLEDEGGRDVTEQWLQIFDTAITTRAEG